MFRMLNSSFEDDPFFSHTGGLTLQQLKLKHKKPLELSSGH
uniref:Myeloid leukemia factor 1 n=2 Tax=Homo sapiens TaxID=9606 RepID=F8VXT4_HUMAN